MALETGDERLVSVTLTHNLCPEQTWPQIRMQRSMTVLAALTKACRHTGSSPDPGTVSLVAYDAQNQEVGALEVLERTIGSYGIADGYRLHVIDRNPDSILLEIQKAEREGTGRYKLSDEEYGKKKGTAREFLKNLKRDRPELFQKKSAEGGDDDAGGAAAGEAGAGGAAGASADRRVLLSDDEIKALLNQRCQIKGTTIRGVIAYVGPVSATIRKKHQLPHPSTAARVAATGQRVAASVSGSPAVCVPPGGAQPPEESVYVGVRLDLSQGTFDGTDLEGKKILFDCAGRARGGLLLDFASLEYGPQYAEIDDLDQLEEL